MMRLSAIAALLIFLALPAAARQNAADRDFFEEGKTFLGTNNWERALRVWYQGRTSLDMAGLPSDPRIGIAFIELVTEKKTSRYYGNACDLYLWGFSNFDFDRHANTVKLEIERLLPLLQDEEHAAWRALLESRDASRIGERIRTFWLERDPTPTTPGNERLIEHWERIDFARKNYTRNIRLPYRTDDRGVIYVKYGRPTKMKSGRMGSNPGELMRLIDDVQLREEIRYFDANPEYELWIYDELGVTQPVFFLFGNRDGNGPFSLLNGVEDLISQRAFAPGAARATGIHAGYYLQIMYYNELRVMDSFFEHRYAELDAEWTRQRTPGAQGPNIRKLKDYYNLLVQTDRLNPSHKYAIPELSTFEEQFSAITIFTQQARFLDANQQPKLAVISFATPKFKTGDIEIVDNQAVRIPEFTVKQSLIVRDREMNELSRQESGTVRGLENTAVFIVDDVVQRSAQYVVAAEALARNELAAEPSQQVFGLGKAVLDKPAPLSANPDSLEVSDLIVGAPVPETVDVAQLPFPIIPSRRVLRTDPLQVYVEVYHLAVDPEERLARFRIDWRVSKLGQNWEREGAKEIISSGFDFRSPAATAKESFGVDISNLTRGNYELSIIVTDRITRQNKLRSARFSVMEPVR